MSVVSPFGASAGRGKGEGYGDGNVKGTDSACKANGAMNGQYRPNLCTVPFSPYVSSEPVASKPFISSNIDMISMLSNQTNNFYLSNSRLHSLEASLLSSKPSLSEAQRQVILRATKMNNLCSSASPLSPQESYNSSSNATLLSPPSTECRRLTLQNQVPLLRSDSLRAPRTSFQKDLQFSDLPIVRGPSAFKISFASSSESQTRDINDNGQHFRTRKDLPSQPPSEIGDNEHSKRLKRTLEELERELLSDDAVLPSSVDHGLNGTTFIADPGERHWADVIEDLLSESPSFPSQASNLPTMQEQQEFSCSNRISNSLSVGQGSFASETTSEANATAQKNSFSGQQTLTGQSQGSEVTSVTARMPQKLFMTGQPRQSSHDPTRHPKQLLISCAAAITENDFELARSKVASLKQVASIYGDPMQRLTAYMIEALISRLETSGSCLLRQVKVKDFHASDLLPAMQVLYQRCPYFKFGYIAANGVILEALKDEENVHIIDFEIGQGRQWVDMIMAFAVRPGGPPKVRITGVGDPESSSTPSGGLLSVGKLLGEQARSVGISFEFHPIAKKASEVEPSMLEKRPGEAIAVNFAFQLHSLPDESVCTTNPRDRLLRIVQGLKPKVVTLVEFEANTNTAPFYPRFLEALGFYTAMFESLDYSLDRECRDRVNVERNWLAKDIVNVVSCEGSERVKRFEIAGKWRARMTMAGFRLYPLSSAINSAIKSLLKRYSGNYNLREEAGTLHLSWLDRVLIMASAWQ